MYQTVDRLLPVYASLSVGSLTVQELSYNAVAID